MRPRFVIHAFIVLSLSTGALTPAITFAEGDAPLDRKTIEAETVDDICSDRGEWLQCYGHKPLACTEISSGIVSKCFDRVLGRGPITTTAQGLDSTVKKLTTCFRDEFLARYDLYHKNTLECAEPPEHLR